MYLLEFLLQIDTALIDTVISGISTINDGGLNQSSTTVNHVDPQFLKKSGIGAVGGLILSIYNFVYQTEQLPTVVKSQFFILHFLLWPAIGFLIPWIYLMDGNGMSWFLCFQTGLTGPAIIQGLFSKSNETIITEEDA